MAKAGCASFNTVVSTLLLLDHMPKKQEGQDLGTVTVRKVLNAASGSFLKCFFITHTQTNRIPYRGDFMRCLNSFVS